MQSSEDHSRGPTTRTIALALGLFLLTGLATRVEAVIDVAGVCGMAGNVCAGGVANINVVTPVQNTAVLNFNAAGFPTVNVNAGGALQLEVLRVGQQDLVCPAKPSATMEIVASDLTINAGGVITGSYPGPNKPTGLVNGSAISILLTQDATHAGSLIIRPGGQLTSDRLFGGNGRGGNIVVVADGQIDVQADPSGTPRGLISGNTDSSARNAFFQDCGRTEITLIANGSNPPMPPGNEAVHIAGTVEIVSPPGGNEGFIGGLVSIVGGGSAANLAIPFPAFPSSVPVSRPNPPDNSAVVLVTNTGLINIDAKDGGGGEVRIFACFVTVNGLIQVGGNAHTGVILGKEQILPIIVEIIANENIAVVPAGIVPGISTQPGVPDPVGGVQGDLRGGFRQHVGQGLTDAVGMGSGCVFLTQIPPKANGSINNQRGGADICLIARADVVTNGTALIPFLGGEYAVRARTGVGSGGISISAGQTGGTILDQSTQQGDVILVSNALTVAGTGQGGLIVMQSAGNITVTSSAQATPIAGGGSGGAIRAEAVNGAITTPAGTFIATPGGTITLRECIVNAANNPATNPAATLLAMSCGVSNLVLAANMVNLAPCQGCSCIDGVRLQGLNTVINGQNLDAVRQVAFTPTCNAAADAASCVVNVPFVSQSDTSISVLTPACAVIGDHVVIGDPGPNGILGDADDLSPSTSCSRDVFPF